MPRLYSERLAARLLEFWLNDAISGRNPRRRRGRWSTVSGARWRGAFSNEWTFRDRLSYPATVSAGACLAAVRPPHSANSGTAAEC